MIVSTGLESLGLAEFSLDAKILFRQSFTIQFSVSRQDQGILEGRNRI